jgi:uncharacterized protein YdhG (YjbR/CyaY superfamily)
MANPIDAYIASFPQNVQELLKELRGIVQNAAPEAEEVISYGMPAIKQRTVLVYYAGYKNHIGFYPTGRGITAFQDRFAGYVWSKGAVQFPLDKPLPAQLITDIVDYRVKQDAEVKE